MCPHPLQVSDTLVPGKNTPWRVWIAIAHCCLWGSPTSVPKTSPWTLPSTELPWSPGEGEMLLLLLPPGCRLNAWERCRFPFRDGQSGKVTVDDYGARTSKSPGKMRQLNINGDLYVGECSPFTFRTQVHFCVCEVSCKAGRPSSVCLKVKASRGSLRSSTAWFLWGDLSGWDGGTGMRRDQHRGVHYGTPSRYTEKQRMPAANPTP